MEFYMLFASFSLEKPSLQSRFTLLPSKFFPAKFPFSKIQMKNLAEKNLLCKRVNFTLQRIEVLFHSIFVDKLYSKQVELCSC